MGDGFNQSSRGSAARMLRPHEKRVALYVPRAFTKICNVFDDTAFLDTVFLGH